MKLIAPTGAEIFKLSQSAEGVAHIADVRPGDEKEHDVDGTGDTDGFYENQSDYRDILGEREFICRDKRLWPESVLRLIDDDACGTPSPKHMTLYRTYVKKRSAAIKAKKGIAKHAAALIKACEAVLDASAGQWKGKLPQDHQLVVNMRSRMTRLANSAKNYVK